jgi:hypothetical protein
MTTDDPGSTNYLLGRIDGKIDRLDEKLDHQGQTLAGHAERLGAVERDVRDIKAQRLADQAARAAEQQQSQQGMSAMKVGVVSAVTAALIGGGFTVIQIVTKS